LLSRNSPEKTEKAINAYIGTAGNPIETRTVNPLNINRATGMHCYLKVVTEKVVKCTRIKPKDVDKMYFEAAIIHLYDSISKSCHVGGKESALHSTPVFCF
jgi:hypothetical protein